MTLAIVCGTGEAAVSASSTVPDVRLKDVAGHPLKLSALRGNVVVLSFWATWCGPCQEELPRLSKLREGYLGKPVTFIAVSIDEAKDRAKIAPFLQRAGVQLEAWTGADTNTMARIGLGDIVPSTVVIDERGKAVTRIEGEAQDEDVRTPVDWLLAGSKGPAPAARVKRY